MFAKIFKRVSILTFIASFFLFLIIIFFSAYCIFSGELTQKIILKTLWMSLFFIGTTLLVSLSENKNLNQRFGAVHLLSFPLTILLYNYEGTFDFKKGLITLGLLIVLNIYTTDLKQKQPSGQIFLLGILITCVSFFNYFLAFFYAVPLLFFLEPQYRKRKNGILLLASIFLTLQFLMAVSYLTTDSFFYGRTPTLAKNPFASMSQNVSETPWIITIIFSLLISIFNRPKEYKFAVGKNDAYRAFQFMLVWQIISILFRSFDLYLGNEKWILSIIPTAFFLGLAIEFLSKDRLKNSVIIMIILVGATIKLYQHQLISF